MEADKEQPTGATEDITPLHESNRAARLLGVPCPWLTQEIKAGRISALRVGRKFFVDLNEVNKELRKRMADPAIA